ncbi:MAG: hypothetical protein GC155_15090 [Alphaproteobacteria bacterium]|nr:hypothetical protein [Alphaproteobacteria bacterium]
MKLADVIDLNRVLEVVCDECCQRTPLDPTFFVTRRGLAARIEDIGSTLVCPCCGSHDIELRSTAATTMLERA